MTKTSGDKKGGILEFAEKARAKSRGRVKSSILERWNTRVVPRGLDKLGRNGAELYIESYGKGIAGPKVTELALCAELRGAGDMAAGFWESAYFLSTGLKEGYGCGGEGAIASQLARGTGIAVLEGLPEKIQPGAVHTMQPVDAALDRSEYINDGSYYGQPKRDGVRNVFFATCKQCSHQSRSTGALPQIGGGFEEAAMEIASKLGPFVLDGERYHLSHRGSEHRTAAQAATVNIEDGKGDVQPVTVYAIFKALFSDGEDLRNGGEDVRLDRGAEIGNLLAEKLKGARIRVEVVPTARTRKEKNMLSKRQMEEGREGEVWTRKCSPYTGGKGHKGDAVRTKYLGEDVFRVISVTETDKNAGGLASVEVADSTGKTVGSVGTGFDGETGRRILSLHKKAPGEVRILVRYQGVTEHGRLWHARFLEIENDLDK